MDRSFLNEALCQLIDGEKWISFQHRKRPSMISVDRVLSNTWSQGRYNYYMRTRLAEYKPINVTRIRLDARTFYLINDGNHRNEAAKTLGHKRIKAIITGEYILSSGDYYVRNSLVWRTKSEGVAEIFSFNKLNKEVIDCLRELGIKEKISW